MYHINDNVLYGSHGVCQITDISELSLSGPAKKYYILKPVSTPASTIYVPLENETLTSKMRCVLSVEEIHELIRSIPDEKSLWIENEPERKERYKEIVQKGDRHELIQMVKALYQHQQKQLAKGKRLHAADERYFKEAEKLLYEEFAIVLNIQPSQVIPFIMEQIELS
jgi:CarD family transcriptional regulator